MFFGSASDNKSAQDYKLCHYKCDCSKTEFKVRIEKGYRKLRRWCKNCKKLIYPIAVTQVRTTQRDRRPTLPSSRR
jgi:hypothetical protein